MAGYQLKTERIGGYLHARVRGENSRENVLGYLADIYRLCEESGCSNLLIEERLEGPSLRVLDVFEVIRQAGTGIWPVVKRIAYVDTHPEHFPENMQFAETVAANLGVNVRVFDSIESAEAWIGEPPAA